MRITQLFLFLLFFLQNVNAQGPISFTEPQVGQQNCYLHFHGSDYCNQNEFETITYFNDTLILTIDSVLASGDFIVSEKLSDGSDGTIWSLTTAIEPVSHTFQFENDSLTIISNPNTSSLWSWLGSEGQQSIDLNETTENQTFIKGWKTGLSCSPTMFGFAIEQNILGKIYDHLNININDSAFDVDGEGYTFIYNLEEGIVAYYSSYPWTLNGIGWHLIPECTGCSSSNIDLGEDIVLGPSESYELHVDGNFETYQWAHGSTLPTHLLSGANGLPGIYDFQLTVTDAGGCSWTDSVNVEILLVDDVNEIEDDKKIEIYPTLLHSNSPLFIYPSGNSIDHLEINVYNQLGKLVFQTTLGESKQYIDELSLGSGIYFIQCKQASYFYPAQKIIVH